MADSIHNHSLNVENIETHAESEFKGIARITAGVCKKIQALPCLPGEPGGCGPIPMRHCSRAYTRATGFAEKVTGEVLLAANNCNFKFLNTAKNSEYQKHSLLS
jgi:hypothetical protein